jgi:hypothetical protein
MRLLFKYSRMGVENPALQGQVVEAVFQGVWVHSVGQELQRLVDWKGWCLVGCDDIEVMVAD